MYIFGMDHPRKLMMIATKREEPTVKNEKNNGVRSPGFAMPYIGGRSVMYQVPCIARMRYHMLHGSECIMECPVIHERLFHAELDRQFWSANLTESKLGKQIV